MDSTRPRLSTLDRGQGPALVLVHGFPGNARDFAPLVERLAATHRVLVPDLLGFGHSPAPTGSLWIDRQAAALDHTLAELGVREATFVGHDVGGPIAAWMAAAWGPRARGLVVASCSLVGDPPIPPPFRLLGVPLLGAVIERLAFSGPALRALGRWASRGPAPTRNSAAEVRAIRRIFATALKDMPAHYARLEARLPKIGARSVFVVGDRDPFFAGDFARRMASLLPGGRLEVLARCAHFPQLERPEDFADVIRSVAA